MELWYRFYHAPFSFMDCRSSAEAFQNPGEKTKAAFPIKNTVAKPRFRAWLVPGNIDKNTAQPAWDIVPAPFSSALPGGARFASTPVRPRTALAT
jgi:hypothetical protein